MGKQGFQVVVFCLIHACLLRECWAIVGGTNVGEPIPWLASLRDEGEHSCGGTLIRSNVVLTAAHCVGGRFDEIEVHFGRTLTDGPDSFTTFTAVESIKHPNYRNRFEDYDIALMVLDRPHDAELVDLAFSGNGCFGDRGGGCETLGYGYGDVDDFETPSATLQEVTITSIGRNQCSDDLDGGITRNMICAGAPEGGRGHCTGDSGGPLLLNGRQVGIVSFGDSCVDPNNPGVYASIPAFRTWIERTLIQINSGTVTESRGNDGGGGGGGGSFPLLDLLFSGEPIFPGLFSGGLLFGSG